jgi:hypothetical protein
MTATMNSAPIHISLLQSGAQLFDRGTYPQEGLGDFLENKLHFGGGYVRPT